MSGNLGDKITAKLLGRLLKGWERLTGLSDRYGPLETLDETIKTQLTDLNKNLKEMRQTMQDARQTMQAMLGVMLEIHKSLDEGGWEEKK